jgi:hypothetical protein
MRIRRYLLVLIAVAGIASIAWIVYRLAPSRILVIVNNHGPETLWDVTVHVTGAAYNIGDLPPGANKRVGVAPTGESGVRIEFADKTGKRVRSEWVGYFESGYGGSIRLDWEKGRVESEGWKPASSYYYD